MTDLTWLTDIYAHPHETDANIDLVFEKLDDLMEAGLFDQVDDVLGAVDIEKLEPVVALAFLSTTRVAKKKLTQRAKLVSAVEAKRREDIPDSCVGMMRRIRLQPVDWMDEDD